MSAAGARWGLMAALLLGAGLRAQEAPVVWPPVSMTFDQVDVRQAIQQLHEKTGGDFVVGVGVAGAITARFVDQPLDAVIAVIARAVGAEAVCVENVWILRLPEPEVPEPQPARGAAALLPDFVPTAPRENLAGTGLTPPPTFGDPGTPGEHRPPEIVTEQINVDPRNWPVIARLLGLDPGTPPPDWLNATGGPQAAGDPYRNLPPRARVTRAGTILMPNGTVILPSGTVVLPDGSVHTPTGPIRYNVPWGWRPPQYQQQGGGYLGLSLNGWKVGLGEGGAVIQPPAIGLNGGQGAVHLPPVYFGPGGAQLGQLGGSGFQYYWDPATGQWQAPRFYIDQDPPNVHMGENPYRNGLPPGWTFTMPPGFGGMFGNQGR